MAGKLKISSVLWRDAAKEKKKEEKALVFELMWHKGHSHGRQLATWRGVELRERVIKVQSARFLLGSGQIKKIRKGES